MTLTFRSLTLTLAQATAVLLVPSAMVLGYLHAGELAGLRLGIENVKADYVEGLAWAVALTLTIPFWPIAGSEKRALVLLWLIRVGVMLGAMLPYEAYYGLDASVYLREGAALADPWSFMAFGRGTDNIIALSALLQGLTDSYSALKVVWGYIGLIAVFVFYRTAVMIIGRPLIAVLFVLGMFPSILFWSSILGKDPIVLLGVAIYCYGAAGYLLKRRWAFLLAVAAGILIAASIRIWLGVIFTAPLIATVVLTGRAPLQAKIAFLLLSIPAGMAAIGAVGESFSIGSAEELVERTDVISRSWSHGGSGQEIETAFRSMTDLVMFVPAGAFAALFRPLPGEVMNPFGLLAGLENAAVLLMLALGLRRSGFAWIREPVLFWAVATLAIWAACYGFASYQNLGTAFRFRVQVAPILLLLTMLLAFWPRLIASGTGPHRPVARPRPLPAE